MGKSLFFMLFTSYIFSSYTLFPAETDHKINKSTQSQKKGDAYDPGNHNEELIYIPGKRGRIVHVIFNHPIFFSLTTLIDIQ